MAMTAGMAYDIRSSPTGRLPNSVGEVDFLDMSESFFVITRYMMVQRYIKKLLKLLFDLLKRNTLSSCFFQDGEDFIKNCGCIR